MKKQLLLFAILSVLFSCGSDDENIEYPNLPPTEEELAKQLSDSLINAYQSELNSPNDLSGVSIMSNATDTLYLTGKINSRMWIGLFYDAHKIIESELSTINSEYTVSGSPIYVELEQERFYEVYAIEEEQTIFKDIVKLDLSSNQIKYLKQEINSNEGKSIITVHRGFENSYLFLAAPYGTTYDPSNDIIYANSEFNNLEVWRESGECYNLNRIPYYVFISKNLFIEDPMYFDIRGGSMDGCISWNVNVPQDIYGLDGSCVNCTIEIDIISKSIEEVIFESNFSYSGGQKRRFSLNPENGELLSNVVIQ